MKTGREGDGGGGKQRGQRSVHVRCKEVLEGHPLKIYVYKNRRSKVMGREDAQSSGGVIE